MLAGIWLIHGITLLEDLKLTFLGIYPLHVKGLVGIVTSPFIHGSTEHAISNSLPLLFLGGALHYAYPKIAFKVWFFGTIFCGFWVWIAARPSYHIGASGVVYALFGFLFVGGLLSRQRKLMGICLLIAFLYGGMIWGIFPVEEKVSWEAHFFGLAAGISLAIYYRKESEYKKPSPWEQIGEENYIREAEEKFGERYWEGNTSEDVYPTPTTSVYHYTPNKKSPNSEESGD